MKSWYKKTSSKVFLILTALLCSAILLTGFNMIVDYPFSPSDLFSSKAKAEYKDTDEFAVQVRDIGPIIQTLTRNSYFHADGSYDPDTKVDLYDYLFGPDALTVDYPFSSLSSELAEANPLYYRLGDLISWSSYDVNASSDQKIIVCKKDDGSYDYFSYDDFKEKILAGEYSFSTNSGSSKARTEDFLLSLYNNVYMNDVTALEESDFKGIKNKKGKLVYIDCWNYDGNLFTERFAPLEYKDLMELANTDPTWSGKLSLAYQLVADAIHATSAQMDGLSEVQNYFLSKKGSISYLYVDPTNKLLSSNISGWTDYKKADTYLKEFEEKTVSGSYVIYSPFAETKTNIAGIKGADGMMENPTEGCYLCLLVDTTYPTSDALGNANTYYTTIRPLVRNLMIFGGISAVLLLLSMIFLTLGAGRRPESEEIHLARWDHLPTEPSAIGILLLWIIPLTLFGVYVTDIFSGNLTTGDIFQTSLGGHSYWFIELNYGLKTSMIYLSLLGVYCMLGFLTGYLSLVRRIKAGLLWKNSVLKWLWGWIWKFFSQMNHLWKIALCTLLYGLILLIGIAGRDTPLILLPFIGLLLIFVYVMKYQIGQNKLMDEIRELKAGNLDYEVNVKELKGIQKEMASELSHVRDGLGTAIEKAMKSERMKTELITNVSHDLKTPLTSIINYVDLLDKEHLENENAQKYIEVLKQKSKQLKNLTEDVVEASKASSGNITLERMDLDIIELLTQCSGEYLEKFASRNLNLVENFPDPPVMINGDGRRLWRIFSNLYSNVYKYAFEGSRVYADLKTDDQQMIFSLKNISQNPLNIDADELTERFIRGDVSRTTEGSGLGLSIARSLTEIQGGTFQIYLDGDLFKVTITFPLVK